MKHLFFILIFLVGFAATNSSFAQTDTSKTEQVKMKIIKNDGAIYTGYILSDDGREVLINTDQVGRLYLPKHMIKLITEVGEETDVLIEENQQSKDTLTESVVNQKNEDPIKEDEGYKNYISTKYIQSDNAYPLRKGEAFIKFMPVGVEAQIPITKNWSIGAVSTYFAAPVGLKTKYSFPLKDSSYLSIEANYGTMAFASFMDLNERNGGGYASLTYTFGNRQTNFSVKLGYALVHQYWEDWIWDDVNGTLTTIEGGMAYNQFMFGNFGGMLQLNDGLSLVVDVMAAFGQVESWGESFDTYAASASVAARFGRNPRHKFQMGGSLFLYDGFFVPAPIPNLSYTYVFNKRNP